MTYSTCRKLALSCLIGYCSLGKTLTLQEAYRKALEKTESLPIQQSLTSQAEERSSQTTGRLFPNLSFIAGYQKLPSQDDTGGAVSAFRQTDQTNARFSLVQPLFRGLGEFAEMRSRGLLVDSQKAAESQTRLNIYSSVAQAYFGVLSSVKDIVNLKALLELTGKRVEELKARTRIGKSRKGELLTALSQVATLEATLQSADATLEQAREAFFFATGVDGGDLHLTDMANDTPPSLPELNSLLDAVEKRPDIQSSKATSQAALESVTVARSLHFPTLDFTANYYLKRAGVLSDLKWDLNLALVVPLFAGGTTQAQVREASERYKQSELQLAQFRRAALRDVRTTYKSLNAQIAQHKALKTALKISKDNYEEQNRDYRYGLATHLDVLQALNTYQETQRLLDRTRYQALANYATLQAATGQIPEEAQ